MHCAFLTPIPLLWCWFVHLNLSAANSPAISEYFACVWSNDNALSRCISTLRTSDVSPTLAMAQILPPTNPSTSVGGRSAHWHCSWDSKLCLPCRHSFAFCISTACSLVAFLSKGFSGVLQYMTTQGCCRNARFATTKSSRDSARLNPCANRQRNSLSTLNVIKSMNCTPSNQLYTPVTQDSHWQVASFTPVCYPPPTHHTQSIESAVPMFLVFLWKHFACHAQGTSESGIFFWCATRISLTTPNSVMHILALWPVQIHTKM